MPKLKTVREKWVLTTAQAASLLNGLPMMPKAIVGLALSSGMRIGELFALRWKNLNEVNAVVRISEAVYEGCFDTPKTAAGLRSIPLCSMALKLLAEWKSKAKRTEPESLVFSTRSGLPISPNNILRRFVFPACESIGVPHATWLTFRRTYSSWSHDKNVPDKVLAELMGHSHVYTTLNVYTQPMHDSLRAAVNRVGEELFSIVQSGERVSELIH